jgi:TolB protein
VLLAVGVLALALLCVVALAGGGLVLLYNRAGGQADGLAAELALPAEQAATATEEPLATGVNRIVFVDPDGRLGTVAPDGSDVRLVSGEGAVYQFPAWSPDGSRIAAVGSNGEQGLLAVLPDQEAAPVVDVYRSASRSPFYLYWSPDGRQVSFLANDPGGIALHLAPADGSAESRVLATGQPFYWDWSQGADQLLIHTGGAGDAARLAVIDTGGATVADGLASPGLFQAPGISASGRYIAYAEAGDELKVVIMDEGGESTAAVPHRGLVAMSWSPAADQLAFTSPEQAQVSFIGPLRLLDAENGEVRTLVREQVITFFWSPDGRSIAYLTREAGTGGPQAGRPLGLARAAPVSTTFQDRDRLVLRLWVVDVASGEQRLLTSFQPTPIFVTQFIPYFDQYALSHRLWSPEGDAVVLPMLEDGHQGIYVIPIDGAQKQRVADGSMAFWSPR